jgi:site-specific DNA recombinase
VVICVRVSTEGQERDGTSLDSQQRACHEFAIASGWQVVECVRDTASGYTLDRAGIERQRSLIRQGAADVVVAHAVDRLSRNQNHIGVLFDEFQGNGVKLEFVTERFEDTAVGRFILAARAFIAEVEREKIVERTTRGKTERARSGRIPQATGRGIYGYHYDPVSGRRLLHPEQAPVVRRIFAEVLAGTPIINFANRLNGEGVRALQGGLWHPATLHHMLRNETYTGRTVYRRTVAKLLREPGTGRKRRKVEQRDPSEWIEIDGATPPIVDRTTFEAVQALLDNPERLRQGRRVYDYLLAGRVRCLACGRAMVGQTLQQRYRYYRCRSAFAGPRHDRCPTLYVRAEDLEREVRREIADALASPERIAAEYQRLGSPTGAGSNEDLERQIARLDDQKRRLVKLYQLGEVDDSYFESEARALRARREVLVEQVARVPATSAPPSMAQLQAACAVLRAWVEQADGDAMVLLASALQLVVHAEAERVEVDGVLPDDLTDYATACSDAHVRAMVGSMLRVPFTIRI